MLVINPDECIDCALCEPECPAEAIFAEDELPVLQSGFLALNADLCETWPNITEAKPPPADADAWLNKPGKLGLLERNWPE